MPNLKGKKAFSYNEIVVLTAIFAQSDFSAGDYAWSRSQIQINWQKRGGEDERRAMALDS